MQPTPLEMLKVFAVDGSSFVYAPAGRSEELCVHLASHGIQAEVSRIATDRFDRIELKGHNEPETVQAILDQWES